jgi:transposase InsO family protein
MSLKIELVERAFRGENVRALAAEFGVTHTAAYKWIKRFKAEGYAGLEEKSRRPNTAPLATAEDIVFAVLEARESHPRWGPRKIEVLLRRTLKEKTPSERTIARILKRAEKVRERRRRRPLNVVELAPIVAPKHPNDVWTIDFKGWWLARNGERCEPLTIRDAFSRFVLAIVICRNTIKAVRGVMESVFRKYGVPNAIQSDNGTPFASVTARGGLTNLSAWWMSLGIRLIRTRRGCPQDNGAHERLHADLAAEIEASPGSSAGAEQRRLDRWRQQFNHVRPHDALEGKTPSEIYKVTERRRFKPVPHVYPSHVIVRRVWENGEISIRKERYFVTEALAGFDVGIERIDDMQARVWFRDIDLGFLEMLPDVDDDCFDLASQRTYARRK